MSEHDKPTAVGEIIPEVLTEARNPVPVYAPTRHPSRDWEDAPPVDEDKMARAQHLLDDLKKACDDAGWLLKASEPVDAGPGLVELDLRFEPVATNGETVNVPTMSWVGFGRQGTLNDDARPMMLAYLRKKGRGGRPRREECWSLIRGGFWRTFVLNRPVFGQRRRKGK